MVKGLAVYNGFRLMEATKYKIKRLQEEFQLLGIGFEAKDSLSLKVDETNSEISIKGINDYAFCVYLDKDESLASLLEKKLPLFNSAESTRLCNDKMRTYIALTGSGLKTPKTIPSRLCFRKEEADPAKIDSFAEEVGQELGYPLICKDCFGSLGLQVYLIKSQEELKEKYAELALEPHLYQQFISSSCGKDFRIFVLNGKTIAYMERVNDHDFRSNIALGGVGYLKEPPKGFKEAAEKAAEILGLDFGGIDVLIGPDNEPIISEVNSNAFFTEIEKVSHVNVTGLVTKHIATKLHLI